MNSHKTKRIIAFVLAVIMLCSMPLTAFAYTGTNVMNSQLSTAYSRATGSNEKELNYFVETPSNADMVETPSNAMFFLLNGFESETHDVFKSIESTIAPGVTQSINYAYSKDGK